MEDLYNLGVKAIIRNQEDKILVLKVSQKEISNVQGYTGGVKYDLPGGRVEIGDTIQQTLEKEVDQETGLKVTSSKYLTTVFSQIRLKNSIAGDVGLILAIFEVGVESGRVSINDESESYEWVTPADASKMLGDKYSSDFCQYIADLPFPRK